MRKIDADLLKENVEYACEANGDALSLAWLKWFTEVIDRMPTVPENSTPTKEDEWGSFLYHG